MIAQSCFAEQISSMCLIELGYVVIDLYKFVFYAEKVAIVYFVNQRMFEQLNTCHC